MLIKSGLVTQISGSFGGMTGSHNKSGMYLRARTIPVNPSTPQQVVVRNLLAQLVTAWRASLSQTQRDAWAVYADNVTKINPLGDAVKISGNNWYIAGNTARLQSGLTRVDDAPTIFDRGTFDAPTATVDATADTIDLTFDSNDAWANEDDAGMLLFTSRPQNETINFFKGPYRLAGSVLGNGTTAPTSPATIALPFPVAAGNLVFARIVVVRGDGRASSNFFLSTVAT